MAKKAARKTTDNKSTPEPNAPTPAKSAAQPAPAKPSPSAAIADVVRLSRWLGRVWNSMHAERGLSGEPRAEHLRAGRGLGPDPDDGTRWVELFSEWRGAYAKWLDSLDEARRWAKSPDGRAAVEAAGIQPVRLFADLTWIGGHLRPDRLGADGAGAFQASGEGKTPPEWGERLAALAEQRDLLGAAMELGEAAGVKQGREPPGDDTPNGPALTFRQSRVLQTMARFDASQLLSSKVIAAEMDATVRLSEETVRQCVGKLIESLLAERPEGDRSGARLTSAGRRLAGKIAD